jgi:hypothetical protein
MRYARIFVASERDVAAYLPRQYSVLCEHQGDVIIEGEDDAGWTLGDYVLPRLASGLYFGGEITQDEADALVASTAP